MYLQLIVQTTKTCSTLFIQKKKRPVSNERLKVAMDGSHVIARILKFVFAQAGSGCSE